jgi:glycosyltransferase involved in cell wall biosynthesis
MLMLLKDEIYNETKMKNVNYKGWVDRKTMREVLKKSKAGLVTFLPLPNHVSAQPNKIFEYMSAGIPVIASNFDLWREIIEGNSCGICVNPENPTEIAQAINYLIANDKEAQKMGENGKRAVVEKYNWTIEKKKLFNVYHNQL